MEGMGKWVKRKRDHAPVQQESRLAKLSLFFLLLNVFVAAGLRGLDVLIVSLAAALVALAGMLCGRRALHQLRRRRGRIGGESFALIGYWGNLIIFILMFLFFSYLVAIGILSGNLLL